MIYLYVKTHNITGMKYFGKTTRNLINYTGSGKYWKRHLDVYGNDCSTKIVAEFEDTDKDQCSEFAINFSREHQIVESHEWANLIEENGLDGAPMNHPPHIFTDEQKTKISQKSKEMWGDLNKRKTIIQSQKDSWTSDRRFKQSQRLKGVARPNHSQKMKGRPLSLTHPWHNGAPKTEDHKKKISEGLRGKPKSQSHMEALRGPKTRVCRLTDKKEMSVNHFTRWLKSISLV